MYHIAFPARTNRESWKFLAEITDIDNNPVDLTGCTFVFQIADRYGRILLTASSDNGKLTILDLGLIQAAFTLQDMRALCPGTYQTGLTVTNDDGTQTVQLTVGPLPIISGVVS